MQLALPVSSPRIPVTTNQWCIAFSAAGTPCLMDSSRLCACWRQSVRQSVNRIDRSIDRSINQSIKSFNFSPAKRYQLQHRHYYYQTSLNGLFSIDCTAGLLLTSAKHCNLIAVSLHRAVLTLNRQKGEERKRGMETECSNYEPRQRVKRLTHCFSNCPATSLLLTVHGDRCDTGMLDLLWVGTMVHFSITQSSV